MKISAVMGVCADPKYFQYAPPAINSFCANNPGIELNVFTDDVKNPVFDMEWPNLVIWDYRQVEEKYMDEYKTIDPKIHRHMVALEYWDNKIHEHHYVAHLFVMAQNLLTHATHCLMIDSDTYTNGNLLPDLEKWLTPNYDFWQVDRTDDIHHPLRGPDGLMPGAGFTAWDRNGPFIEMFKKHFEWDDQRTMNNHLHKLIRRCLIRDQRLHIVYCFWRATRQNRKITKAYLEDYLDGLPGHFHLGETDVEGKQKILQSWYPWDKKE